MTTWRTTLTAALVSALLSAFSASLLSQPAAQYREQDFLTRIRRLTVEGRRSGEGYWSSDGRRLVFQSEREADNPFYQIYTLDLTSGDTKRISPGTGKTTCPFFRPGTSEIEFASTHADPKSKQWQQEELAVRASGKERRYSWDYDPEMDIYAYNEQTGRLKRLTDARGYDAEGSYSPDGQWLVFTSMRDAYNHPLSNTEKKMLEENPSNFAEIYIMRADGTGQKRLTNVPGYDGGPFFTPDGSRIVWRRFDQSGLIANIWTMKPDGTDQRQITDFGSMSWAPYMHPSGEYIIFASNKLGFENFELFIVDAQGAKEPVRVTYSDGFDGLPVPSPDGTTLAWTSTRSGGAGGTNGQLFLAQWNHAKALEAIRSAPLKAAPARPTAETTQPRAAAPARAHVEALASAKLDGRLTGSAGEQLASDYLISELRRIGARPLPGSSDYRRPFEFTAGTADGGSTLAIESVPKRMSNRAFSGRTDVQALSFSDNGDLEAPVVFAGYGIVVPDGQGFAYDSYAGLDVKDKIVLVLRYFPEDAEQKTRAILSRYADLRYKAMAARQHGARGLLVFTGPRSPNAGETIPMSFDTALAGSGISAASVSGTVANALFAALPDASIDEVQESLDSANPHVAGFALPKMSVTLHTNVVRQKQLGHNVLAYLPATAPAAGVPKPWVAIGAHYDHLGHGNSGSSLARKEETGQVHAGADDNASGSAAVLAIAETLAHQPRHRNILVAFWSGEELGLLGSGAFVAQPAVPLNEIAAYLNFDMVGRMQDNKLTLQASGTSPIWARVIEQANIAAGFDLQVQADPYQPTDVASFNLAGVPCLTFFTGVHADYHRPTDTAERINYQDLDRVIAFAAGIARRVEDADPPPAFTKVDQPAQSGGRGSVRVFTGTIPDYSTEAKGLLLSGVIGGGPAELAGLAKGDVIVEIAGQTIANIYDYTYALDVLKIGQPATVVYMRGGERRETTLTPSARK